MSITGTNTITLEYYSTGKLSNIIRLKYYKPRQIVAIIVHNVV